MRINPFKLERYFAVYEFSAKYLLSPSDCESLSMKELIEMADGESQELWQNLKLGYTESRGHPLLREEISGLYNSLSADHVIVTVPEEGIFIAVNALLEEGDNVIAVDPAYQSLYEIARSIGCSVTRWPVTLKNDRWYLDIDFLEESIKEETRLIIINFPHNPTGYLPSKDELDRIVEIAEKHDIYIFSDEMYRLLEHDRSNTLDAVADIYDKGISLSGLSKTFSLPGLRMGWLATRDKGLMKDFEILKDYTTICGSAPSEILAIIALRNREQIIRRNLGIIRDNIGATKRFFGKYSSLFTWIEPKAGSIAFPKMDDSVSINDFSDRVVREKNIMILPASIFDFNGNHFRIGLGRTNLPVILKELDDYLEKNPLK